MSLNRDQLKEIYEDAKYIHAQSRLADVRRKAKRIAGKIESVLGQMDGQPSEFWKE